jgi:hypothetical protein
MLDIFLQMASTEEKDKVNDLLIFVVPSKRRYCADTSQKKIFLYKFGFSLFNAHIY